MIRRRSTRGRAVGPLPAEIGKGAYAMPNVLPLAAALW